MTLLGNRSRFAIEYDLDPDPAGGTSVVQFNGTFTRDQLLQKSKSALVELDKL